MRATITPGKAVGTTLAPPSKSMAHRMLMGAGLADGTSVIHNIDLSEDIKATLGILEALGARCQMEEEGLTKKVVIEGIGGKRVQAQQTLDAKESGSTLRFFIPILLTGGGKSRLTGAKSLFARPLGIYEEICREQQISFLKTADSLELDGQLQAAHYKVKGNISSQFITGLLFVLPLLEADSVLEVIPPIESKAYIEMTLETLGLYGIAVKREENIFYIFGNQKYRPLEGTVEGDYSNAAFLEVFNLAGGNVNVEGLKENSLQGDKIYQVYFQTLLEENPEMDIAECPDLGPVLMGIAAAKNGAVFTGTKRLKIKESDRGAVMAEELLKFGIQVDVEENRIVVHKGTLHKPSEFLSSHNDHRIAMTLTFLCTITGGVVDGCEAVRKSFPGYYDVIEKLGIRVVREN